MIGRSEWIRTTDPLLPKQTGNLRKPARSKDFSPIDQHLGLATSCFDAQMCAGSRTTLVPQRFRNKGIWVLQEAGGLKIFCSWREVAGSREGSKMCPSLAKVDRRGRKL